MTRKTEKGEHLSNSIATVIILKWTFTLCVYVCVCVCVSLDFRDLHPFKTSMLSRKSNIHHTCFSACFVYFLMNTSTSGVCYYSSCGFV